MVIVKVEIVRLIKLSRYKLLYEYRLGIGGVGIWYCYYYFGVYSLRELDRYVVELVRKKFYKRGTSVCWCLGERMIFLD